MKRRLLVRVCLGVLMVIAGACVGWVNAAELRTAEFLDSEGNVRVGPGTDQKVLLVPEKGARVTILEQRGKWFRVRFETGLEGWCHQINLKMTTSAPRAAELPLAEFTDSEGNVRVGPGTDQKILLVPEKGTRVRILEKRGKWRKIRFENGMEGWCHQINLRGVEQSAAPVPVVMPDEEMARSPLKYDLDGDGALEMVYLHRHKMLNNDPDDAEFHLRVIRPGPQGAVLWEDKNRAEVFYIGHTGVEELEILGDIDGDGAVELVSPRAQSDVRPVAFRLLRWQGGRFESIPGGFLYASAKGPVEFFWSRADLPSYDGICWISRFLDCPEPGKVKAALIAQTPEGMQVGEALLTGGPRGFVLESWTSPLRLAQY